MKPTLEDAIRLAVEAHHGQRDRNGQPYILHPLRVMFRLGTDKERAVAVLHDVVEDTKYSAEDLRQMGYSEEILKAAGLRHAARWGALRGFCPALKGESNRATRETGRYRRPHGCATQGRDDRKGYGKIVGLPKGVGCVETVGCLSQ